MTTQRHIVDYDTRYGRTSDFCYCIRSNGMDHRESATFPWLGRVEGAKQEPLKVPLRKWETPSDYEERMENAEVWQAGQDATSDTPNPYLKPEETP